MRIDKLAPRTIGPLSIVVFPLLVGDGVGLIIGSLIVKFVKTTALSKLFVINIIASLSPVAL